MIVIGNKVDLEALYPVYESLFPEEERKSLDALSLLMCQEGYQLLLFKNDETMERVGFAFVYHMKEIKLLWLDFIAIEPKHQSGGYGSRFFEGILKAVGKGCYGMFMEVEKPIGNDLNQTRRLKYYERLGALYINVDYRLPTSIGGLPMYLMYKPLCPGALTSDLTIKAIERVYNNIHHDVDGTAVLYEAVIKSIGPDLFMKP